MKPSKYVDQKFKKVDGVFLPHTAFAYVGDSEDTSTWKLPIVFRGDVKRTVNHIKNAISRFDEVKGIPATARHTVWAVIRSAGHAQGIEVPFKEIDFERVSAEQPKPEPKPQEPKATEPDAAQAEIAAAIAQADALTEKMLRKLGLE
jgi:hypothetical protein